MKRCLLLLVLLLNLVGCKSLSQAAMQASQSAFLSQFSLSKTLARVNAPGLDCSRFGEGGGIGGSAGGIPSGHDSHSQSDSTVCSIERPEQFDEARFIESLKTEIEAQIKSTGAQIKRSTLSGRTGFQIEYVDGKISGLAEIFGGRYQNTYAVTTKIEENNR